MGWGLQPRFYLLRPKKAVEDPKVTKTGLVFKKKKKSTKYGEVATPVTPSRSATTFRSMKTVSLNNFRINL